jgi:hypothetical protein
VSPRGNSICWLTSSRRQSQDQVRTSGARNKSKRFLAFETRDRICELYGWPQRFLNGAHES